MTFTTLTARRAGVCQRCQLPFPVGTTIRYGGQGYEYHLRAECPSTEEYYLPRPGKTTDGKPRKAEP